MTLTEIVEESERRTREAERPRMQPAHYLAELERILDGRLHVRVNAPNVLLWAKALPPMGCHTGQYLGLLELNRVRPHWEHP